MVCSLTAHRLLQLLGMAYQARCAGRRLREGRPASIRAAGGFWLPPHQRGKVALDSSRGSKGVWAELKMPVTVVTTVELPLVKGFTYSSAGRTARSTWVCAEIGPCSTSRPASTTFVPTRR